MNVIEGASQLIIVMQQALPAVEKLVKLAGKLGWPAARQVPFSYENLALHLTLDIKDAQGRQATVRRNQRVHFLSSEAGVLTNPVWGPGEQIRSYKVEGAKHVGSRFEGHREVLMLGLADRPAKDSIVTVNSERALENGYTREREYFEAAIERPTRHLTLKVLFPKERPPRNALLVTALGRQPKHIRPRFDAHGRVVLTWSARDLAAGTSYSLRWSW